MPNTQELRDRNGRLLGRIIEMSSTRHEIRNANGNLRGTYNPQYNETRDANGNLVGRGNLLVSLLP
jgi:hypothetical protein